jgi:2-dehydropantoate 2-reductase
MSGPACVEPAWTFTSSLGERTCRRFASTAFECAARGDFHAKPHATANPDDVGPVDHVFLGLKANHYAYAGPMIRPLLGRDTSIIAAQNGIPWRYFHRLPSEFEGYRIDSVDPEGAVSDALPVHRAIGCG